MLFFFSACREPQLYGGAEDLDYSIPFVTGLKSDLSSDSNKLWTWGCSKENCKYRFKIDSAPDTLPTGEYRLTNSAHASAEASSGKVFLHVQAIDDLGYESEVVHVSSHLLGSARFALHAHTLRPTVGDCIKLTISTHDLKNELRGVIRGRDISLTGGGSGSYYNTPNCSDQPVSGFRFRPGQATGDIFFRTTVAQTLVLTASDRAEEILPGSAIVVYLPDVPVSVSLGGSPTAVPQGLCSPAFNATVRDQYDNVSVYSSSASLTLDITGNGSGSFYSDSTCTTPLGGSVTLANGSGTSSSFYFKSNAYERLTFNVATSNLPGGTTITTTTKNFVTHVHSSIASGEDHTCVITPSFSVKCAGINNYSQLGDGTNTLRSTPVLVSGLSNVVGISAGRDHTCAIISDGTVKCWGKGGASELGNGSDSDQNTPVSVSNLTGVRELSAGGHHSCVITQANDDDTFGVMKCWGRNDYSQLGDGTTTNSNVPITVSSIAQPISVSSLFDGSCVTINGGTAVCFGRNHQRQLGDGTTTHRTTPSNILTGPGANLTNVKTLFTGIYHGCALLTDNTVKCWGRNAEGQLGNGVTSTTGYAVSPTVISNNVIWVGTGGYSTYFLLSTNDVYSTGYSSDGQSGSGYYINQSTPQSFGLNSVIAISNGSFGMNGCILLSGNTLKCFGRNGYGQLGIGSFLYTPSVVPGLSNVTKIAANVSNATTCAVLNDTTAKCWGVNSYYTLSDGTTTTRTSPAVVKTNDGAGNLSTLSNITSVSTNPYNTCFLLSDKTVHCSGVKTYGGIGDGQNTDRTTAWDTMAVGQSTTIINNANTLTTSGEGATCALLDDQTVKCWGRDNSGTQGRGSNTSSRTTPSNVKTDAATNLTSVTSIALGLYHSCAIASGNVYCWGTNYFGEIGVSTSTSAQYYATQVAGISNAQSIYAGYYNTCVIKTDNTVSCFGNNTNGQFGNGGTTHSTTAIDNIGGFTTALKVGVGLYGICIVLTNGSVYCAGNDGAGLMGTGERGDDRTSFTQVSGISTATDIVQGNNHACALLSDQTVTCWGRDFGGVLGRGTVDQAYPQTVLNYP